MKLVGPPSRMVKLLEDNGYKAGESHWYNGEGFCVAFSIVSYAGKEVKFAVPAFLVEKSRRESLLGLMTLKRDILHESYCYQRDLDEISAWSEADVDRVFERITHNVKNIKTVIGCNTCPFCILHLDNCSQCGYGVRHGCCRNDDSDFRRYIQHFHTITDKTSKIKKFLQENFCK